MAIEIIKEGRSLDQSEKYTYKCAKCDCIFSYTEKDLDWKSTGFIYEFFDLNSLDIAKKNEYKGSLNCPWCGNKNTLITKYV